MVRHFFFFQAEDGIRDLTVTGVQTCALPIFQHSAGAEIVVADNGSTDQSVAVLKNEFPQISIIVLDRNYGFCGGYNRALKQVQADFYVLLNSDKIGRASCREKCRSRW